MAKNSWFNNMLESFKDDFEFRLETLILNLTEDICLNMKNRNINRTQLAEKLNVSSPAVTKILNGNSNFTLKTLLSIADALESDLSVNFKDRNVFAYKQAGKISFFPSATDHKLPRSEVTPPLSSSGFDRSESEKKSYANAA